MVGRDALTKKGLKRADELPDLEQTIQFAEVP